VTVRGELWWPYAGRTRDRTRGTLVAAYGEKPMAIDTRPHLARPTVQQGHRSRYRDLGQSLSAGPLVRWMPSRHPSPERILEDVRSRLVSEPTPAGPCFERIVHFRRQSHARRRRSVASAAVAGHGGRVNRLGVGGESDAGELAGSVNRSVSRPRQDGPGSPGTRPTCRAVLGEECRSPRAA